MVHFDFSMLMTIIDNPAKQLVMFRTFLNLLKCRVFTLWISNTRTIYTSCIDSDY